MKGGQFHIICIITLISGSKELCMLSTIHELLIRFTARHLTCKAHNKQSSPIPVPSPDVRLVSLSLISQGTTPRRVVYPSVDHSYINYSCSIE